MTWLIMTHALRRLTWLVLLGMLPVCLNLVCAAELTPVQLINVAGRQRMLTQRIVKTYIQVGLGVTPDLSRQQLADAVRLFESQSNQLRRGAPDAHIVVNAGEALLNSMDLVTPLYENK